MARYLRRLGHVVGRKRVRRLMAKMGLEPIYQRPRTTVPHPEHKIWPYLLRNLTIDRPDQVWCADITYIPMRRGFLYLVAIPPRSADRVSSRDRSKGLLAFAGLGDQAGAGLAIVEQHGGRVLPQGTRGGHGPIRSPRDLQHRPLRGLLAFDGSQFTSPRFTELLIGAGVKVSMDGRGRWLDNVFIERLWRSLKYECVYLDAFETGSEARTGIGKWLTYYNAERPHSALGGRTTDEAHAGNDGIRLAA